LQRIAYHEESVAASRQELMQTIMGLAQFDCKLERFLQVVRVWFIGSVITD
jgi:hypothetical protein